MRNYKSDLDVDAIFFKTLTKPLNRNGRSIAQFRRGCEINAFERCEITIDISLLYFSLFLYPLGIEGFRGSMERFENPSYKSE
jgi:hypothetical protein